MVDPKQQLGELLADPGYSRTIALLTKEVMSTWNLSHNAARSAVLSAIGDPIALGCIYEAWILARKTGEKSKVPAVISRRRVLDQLAKDARRPRHSSFPVTAEELEAEADFDSLHTAPDRDPRVQLECQQLIQMVRGAIVCFGTQGATQRRQAQLLQRRGLDEIAYPQLSEELACSENALRVRVHAALKALHEHILWCHPELVSMRTESVRARNV